jgi:hypothetical protein
LPSLADQSILLEKSFAKNGEKKSRSQLLHNRFSQTDLYAEIDFIATTPVRRDRGSGTASALEDGKLANRNVRLTAKRMFRRKSD